MFSMIVSHKNYTFYFYFYGFYDVFNDFKYKITNFVM